MTALNWHDGMTVGIAFMDADHHDAVKLYEHCALAADGDALTQALTHLVAHLDAHFSRENDAMARIGFFAESCHRAEHERVLAGANAALAATVAGDFAAGRLWLDGFPEWFRTHRDTMDWVTASVLRHSDP